MLKAKPRLILFLISVLIASASLTHAQTTINSLPYTITAPGTYVLGTSLTYGGSSGSAIQINASNVTVDLNGHYINNAAGPTTQTSGILATNRANVTIQNGIIVGFSYGIVLNGTTLNINGLIQNVRLIFSLVGGILLSESRNAVVRNCQISETGYSESGAVNNPAGIGIVDNESMGGNLISNNNISHSTDWGIALGGNDLADNNFIYGAQIGIASGFSPGELKNNTVIGAPTTYSGGLLLVNNF